MLPGVLRAGHWDTCVTEEMFVLDELCSGMSYSVVDCGFNVNEPLIHV